MAGINTLRSPAPNTTAPQTGVIALPVRLPEDDRQLFLVVSRPDYGRKPWYLITTEPAYSAEQAWQIVLAYARRWQIEMSLRFTKSEMAFESPRLLKWESRLKFLLIASVAYAFLLSLLPLTDLILRLISNYCHRTGKWMETWLARFVYEEILCHLICSHWMNDGSVGWENPPPLARIQRRKSDYSFQLSTGLSRRWAVSMSICAIRR